MHASEILHTAMEQSAEDIGCRGEDFCLDKNLVVPFHPGKNAKKYLRGPAAAVFVSYGNNVVAAAIPELLGTAAEYLRRHAFYHLFETPGLHWLDSRAAPLGCRVCDMAEYFLPDLRRLRPLACDYELRLLGPKDFAGLYLPQWGNALCRERKELDVLGVGAYAGGELAGLAGCSADCEAMWQIGVDVLPAYRRQGIACALTSRLALEALSRGKVPFYCAAWANIRSAGNAIKSGFAPAWAEMTVKPCAPVLEPDR